MTNATPTPGPWIADRRARTDGVGIDIISTGTREVVATVGASQVDVPRAQADAALIAEFGTTPAIAILGEIASFLLELERLILHTRRRGRPLKSDLKRFRQIEGRLHDVRVKADIAVTKARAVPWIQA